MSWLPLPPSLRGEACSEPEASAQSSSLPRISLETQPSPPPTLLIDKSPERFSRPADRPTRAEPTLCVPGGTPLFPGDTPGPAFPLPRALRAQPTGGACEILFCSSCAVEADLVSSAAGGQGPRLRLNMAALGDSDSPETQARPGQEGPKPGCPGPHSRTGGGWEPAAPTPGPPSLPPSLTPGVGVKPQGCALGLVEPGEHGQTAG